MTARGSNVADPEWGHSTGRVPQTLQKVNTIVNETIPEAQRPK